MFRCLQQSLSLCVRRQPSIFSWVPLSRGQDLRIYGNWRLTTSCTSTTLPKRMRALDPTTLSGLLPFRVYLHHVLNSSPQTAPGIEAFRIGTSAPISENRRAMRCREHLQTLLPLSDDQVDFPSFFRRQTTAVDTMSAAMKLRPHPA